jgi:catechol 2,3-dioxygenase-like lactoylglutathione lyase family enzyme
MRSGIAGIDHVVIAVRDLEGAKARWTRLGFTVAPRGRHLGAEVPGGTANYCLMFGRDYLELLGLVEPDGEAARLQQFLARREGAMAVAFAPDGPLDEVRAALLARGLHPGEARALGRRLELPGGAATLRFALLALMPAETPALGSFLCAHLTPELLRRPEWLQHPNGATGLRAVTIVAAETAPLLPAYDRLFGLHEVTTTDALASVRAGPYRLLFATPDDFATMHPGVELAADLDLPGIAALELAVASRADTASCLRQREVEFTELPDGRLAVTAAEASGVILFFAER